MPKAEKKTQSDEMLSKGGVIGLALYNLMLLLVTGGLLFVFWPVRRERLDLRESIAKTEARIATSRAKLESLDEQIADAEQQLSETRDTIGARGGASGVERITPILTEQLELNKEPFKASLEKKQQEIEELYSQLAELDQGYAYKKVMMLGDVSPEACFFLIIILAGILGSLVQSIYKFIYRAGYRNIGKSWAWWYLLRPFWGAGLALVFYLLIRGGLVIGSAGFEAFNPYGLAGLAAIVGMFSRQAVHKLDELFDTLFKSLEPDPGEADKK